MPWGWSGAVSLRAQKGPPGCASRNSIHRASGKRQARADFVLASHTPTIAEGGRSGRPPVCRSSVARMLDRQHRDDLERARLDDDDLVIDDEVAVAAPRRVDSDDRIRQRQTSRHARHHRADVDVEVDLAPRHLRRAARLQHRGADRALLLGRQVDLPLAGALRLRGRGRRGRPGALRRRAGSRSRPSRPILVVVSQPAPGRRRSTSLPDPTWGRKPSARSLTGGRALAVGPRLRLSALGSKPDLWSTAWPSDRPCCPQPWARPSFGPDLMSAPFFISGSAFVAGPAFMPGCSLAAPSAEARPVPAISATAATVARSDFFIPTSPLVTPRGIIGHIGNVSMTRSVPYFRNFMFVPS